MGKVKFKKGLAFVDGKGKNKQTGSDNIDSLQQALSEQAKCSACGCDDCLCYETICAADTGELYVRYLIYNEGDYGVVIEPYEIGISHLKEYYASR